MKKNYKSLFAICLALIFCFSFLTTFADSSIDLKNDKKITKAYDYPVKPKTEEWKKLKTRMEKIDVCQIPESILNNMTTKALVESVMNYPLLIDIVARNSNQEGFDAVYRVFNGLQELTKRSDAIYELKQYQNKVDSFKTEDSEIIVQKYCIKILLECINLDIDSSNKSSIVYPSLTYSSVYTPRGTTVSTYYNSTWADLGITLQIAIANRDAFLSRYPSTVEVSPVSPAYNCHSYAWYSTSSSNLHWMDNPSAYMTDGSYISSTCINGNRVYYGAGNHSAIVIDAASWTIRVRSKWGPNAVFEHDLLDCPYAEGSYNISYWKRNLNQYIR